MKIEILYPNWRPAKPVYFRTVTAELCCIQEYMEDRRSLPISLFIIIVGSGIDNFYLGGHHGNY